MEETARQQIREFILWTTALLESMKEISDGDDSKICWRYISFGQFARKYDQIVEQVGTVIQVPPIIERPNFESMPSPYDTMGLEHKILFERLYANAKLLRAFLEGKIGIVEDRTASLKDFLHSNLRASLFNRPEGEKAVQDAIEVLLIGKGMKKGQEYDRETGRVKISGKESIPDFVFNKLSLALEVKLVKTRSRTKEVVDEISADIVAYSKKYREILFVVYDLGFIQNEIEFRHDLESPLNVSISIIKH